MASLAKKAVEALGAELKLVDLGPAHAVELLSDLRGHYRLSPKSVQCCYGAFTRMLALSGVQTVGWPKAPTPPRVKSREAMKGDDLDALIEWFRGRDWTTTADLAVLLRGTGLRVDVEALTEENLHYADPVGAVGVDAPPNSGYGVLTVTGKGGHERVVPVVDPDCRSLLGDPDRLDAMRAVPYRTHLRRWTAGVSALGIKTRLATPHAVRHGYASSVLARSGGNLVMVQELLGHADPATTARYLSVDLAAKASVLGL